MIAAIKARVHVHSDYVLLASVIVAARGSTIAAWMFAGEGKRGRR